MDEKPNSPEERVSPLKKLRALVGKALKKGGAAAESGWEKASSATADGWDKAGRIFEKLRGAVARHPVSPLLYLTLLAVFAGYTAFHGMYTRAFVLNVDGVEVGLLENQEELDAIVTSLENRVSGILGEEYDYEADITLTPTFTAGSFSDANEVEDVLFDGVGAYMDAWLLTVDGVEMGYAADQADFYAMLDELAEPYLTEDTVSYSFVEDVQVTPVRLPSNSTFDLDAIRQALSVMRTESAYYVVEKGDTFNAIAYGLDMMPDELAALNPEVEVNKLWVGDELLYQQAVPFLSVVANANETYEDVIESPIEYIDTASLYVGSTSMKEKGSDGLALVNADVVYLNGVEQERTIVTSETLVEPTTTYMYNGTTPRPATASNGYFIWPVRGRITSSFGNRYIFGSYSYHGGIDISCAYGTTIKAADGGKVTYAGWQGTYGKLVVITHDDGKQTYYAHNSSILVSVGSRVYQGQAIARAGSTGRATGPHCHFEVRINGTRVNPRRYL